MARHDYERTRPSEQAGACHNASPPPQNAMAETTLNKKMRAFDDEVALTVAPFYLIHMLQRTFPIFISDKVTLHISREKDGKSGLLYRSDRTLPKPNCLARCLRSGAPPLRVT